MADDEYYVAAVYDSEDCKVTVLRPILTPEEREKRMDALKAQTVRFMRNYLKSQEQKAAEK